MVLQQKQQPAMVLQQQQQHSTTTTTSTTLAHTLTPITPLPPTPTPPQPNPTPNPPPIPSQPTVNPPPNNYPMRTRAKNNITKPTQKFSYTTAKSKPTIPKTDADALRDLNWRIAMVGEINAQICNGSDENVLPDTYQNVVGCKWDFYSKLQS